MEVTEQASKIIFGQGAIDIADEDFVMLSVEVDLTADAYLVVELKNDLVLAGAQA